MCFHVADQQEGCSSARLPLEPVTLDPAKESRSLPLLLTESGAALIFVPHSDDLTAGMRQYVRFSGTI